MIGWNEWRNWIWCFVSKEILTNTMITHLTVVHSNLLWEHWITEKPVCVFYFSALFIPFQCEERFFKERFKFVLNTRKKRVASCCPFDFHVTSSLTDAFTFNIVCLLCKEVNKEGSSTKWVRRRWFCLIIISFHFNSSLFYLWSLN